MLHSSEDLFIDILNNFTNCVRDVCDDVHKVDEGML